MPLRARMLRPITRRYPFLSGAAFPNARIFRRLSGSSADQVWAPVPGGSLLVSLDDFVGRCAYFVGDLDPKLSAVFKRVLRTGDRAADIGANIGITSFAMSKLVGPQGHVIAVEPNPDLCANLSASIERSGIDNIRLMRCAVAERADRLTLHVPPKNAGKGSLYNRLKGSVAKQYEVDVVPLAQVLEECGPLRLMKVDVEGAELHVIRGLRDLPADDLPDVIVFELLRKKMSDPDIAEIASIFETLGYELYGIERTLVRLALTKLDLEPRDRFRFWDFVAMRGEPLGASLDDLLRTVRPH